MGSNLVIVAIPAADDPVWKISSEKIPHLTLLFLGDAENNPKINQIFQFVWHAVNVAEHGPFYLDVDRRDILGEDKADVLHFRKKWEFKWIDQFRNQLLQNSDVRTAYDSVEQFPEWRPHLTLGYPETPANEDEIPDHGFGTIRFDRIAVWTGNYEGPQFRLEWPEREEAMAVAYSETGQAAVEELLHVGVKGMRWGVRKEKEASAIEKVKNNLSNKQIAAIVAIGPLAMLSPSIRQNLAKNQSMDSLAGFQKDKQWEKGVQKGKGFGFDDQKFTKDYNAKWKDHDFSKEDWDKPSPTYQKYMDGYFNEMSNAYAKQFSDHFGTSPSGKYETYLVPGTNQVKVRKKDLAQHSNDFLMTFKVSTDNFGLIIKAEIMEDSMKQTVDLGIEFLEHFGTKGMRWGVRKDRVTGAAKATGKFIGDVHFESRAGEDQKARFGIEYQASRDFANKDLPRINAKPEYQAAKKRTHRLRNPIDPVVRQYRNEAKQTYINRLETTANSMKNPSGTREYTIRERGGDLPDSKYIWEVSTRQARHADGEDVLVIEVIMNKDGFITKLNPVVENKSLEQTIDLGAEFLAHYGVKGMRWGQRKQEFVTRQHQQRLKVEAANRNARSPQEVKAYPTIGSSKRKKATVDTKGGEDHPPTEDAIKVAVAKQKLKKSGTAALTNSELQEMQRRLNLENDVQRLLTGDKTAGQRFIDGLLGRGSKEERKSVENQVGQKTSALVAPTAVKIAKKAIVR